ncbi:hypothetical protein Vretimale_17286 [Volvox reticuliferus]|uniref:Uncharacterized protein n=1 Tax=Volvox reticuliferus TaxID=1737510 RepID=A0A8J4GUN0_9CHLO|nr:hypothetical protein Vretifemale_16619 [Volvox reticuliferus]GIM14270.1 hypothetical protein Vretimale_17286 [Volvox reticuliferus]
MPQVAVNGASLRCGLTTPVPLRSLRLKVHCTASGESGDAERPSSSKGKSFSGERRRRGRPAHLRSPDDSPLRDGNRDRLMGLLTERAAKTLAYYLIETNHNVHHWVNRFIKEHPIPRDGNWDDVSGDTFLRTLLSMPIEEATPWGRDPVFHNTSASDVDPRSIAQRIMEIRAQLATEFIEDLKQVTEENKLLQLETLQASLLSTEDAIADGSAAARQAATSPGLGSGGGSPSASGTSTPGSAARGSRGADDVDPSRVKSRKGKKSVLPAQPTPSNWRMRLEVEAQVYGDLDGTPPAPAAPGGGGSGGIPDSVMTGIISPNYTPPAGQPLAATPSSPPPLPEAVVGDADVVAARPPSLHPEVAEMLPLIRSSPSALTPDIAQMLASLAVMSNGKLHPDIVDALQAAVNAGAKLHPEMAELLKLDSVATASAAPPPPTAPISQNSDLDSVGSGSGDVVPMAGAAGPSVMGPVSKAVAPLGQISKPPVSPAAAAAAATAAAAAPQGAESVQVVQSPQPRPTEDEEEENSITALQNDTCLHSDDE